MGGNAKVERKGKLSAHCELVVKLMRSLSHAISGTRVWTRASHASTQQRGQQMAPLF